MLPESQYILDKLLDNDEKRRMWSRKKNKINLKAVFILVKYTYGSTDLF